MGSTFNLNRRRDLFVISDQYEIITTMQKIASPFPSITVKDQKALEQGVGDLHFVVGAIDFQDGNSVREVARVFKNHTESSAQKISYIYNPDAPNEEQLFFCAEIGASLSIYGKDCKSDLRGYIKRVAIQAEQVGSITYYEDEVAKLLKRDDRAGLRALDERLSELDHDLEQTLRLRVQINQRLCNRVKVEYCLKRMLKVNPASIWAAYQLGVHYLRINRPAKGIDLLEKLSRFNELNVERILDLGEAYLNVGEIDRAEQTMEKGRSLTNGQDQRFNEGIAKAKIMRGDLEGALKATGQDYLSGGIVSYLNMRAVMAIKTKKIDDGLDLYQLALRKCVDDRLILSKLNYNMGLGLVKASRVVEAAEKFEKSVALGGDTFNRARGPLEITKKV